MPKTTKTDNGTTAANDPFLGLKVAQVHESLIPRLEGIAEKYARFRELETEKEDLLLHLKEHSETLRTQTENVLEAQERLEQSRKMAAIGTISKERLAALESELGGIASTDLSELRKVKEQAESRLEAVTKETEELLKGAVAEIAALHCEASRLIEDRLRLLASLNGEIRSMRLALTRSAVSEADGRSIRDRLLNAWFDRYGDENPEDGTDRDHRDHWWNAKAAKPIIDPILRAFEIVPGRLGENVFFDPDRLSADGTHPDSLREWKGLKR